jgi:hemolysin activation/secretion protein
MVRRILSTLLLSTIAASAQVAPSRLSVPDAAQVLAPPKAAPQLPSANTLPQQSQATAQAGGTLHFSQVEVVGARMIPAREIEAAFATLRDRDITSNDLKPVLDRIDALYAATGFPLGRAFIPAQRLQDGVLTVHVVEGYIGSIAVTASNARTRRLVERMAARLKAERPLTRATLERVILTIQDIPGMTLTSRFDGMDTATGATRLLLDATVKPVTVAFSLDNRSGLAGLPTAPYIIAGLNNLIGTGDQVTLTALLSPRPKDYAFYGLSLSSLVGEDGLRLGVDGAWAQALDTTSLPGLAVKSQSAQLAAKARYPLLRGQDESLGLQARAYVTNARYSLPSATTSGVLAHDGYVAGELEADYARIVSPTFGLGVTLKANQGISNLTGEPHTRLKTIPRFSRLRGEIKAVWQATDKITLTAGALGQWSPNSLVAAEEATFGGIAYGGAFAPAEIAGDKGVGAHVSPEYRIALGGKWSISPFATGDYAKVWNKRGDSQGAGELVSAGGGLKIAHSDYGAVALEVDKPLNRTPRDAAGRGLRVFAHVEIGASKLMDAIAGNP